MLLQKLFLLKFLCDEALKTPQVRAHLEKSVEVALELQQQLRDLVAERLKIVVPMDAINHAKAADKESLQNPQATSQQRPSLDLTQTGDGGKAVASTVRLELQTLKVAEAAKATKNVPPVPSNDDGFVLRGDNISEMKTQESIVGVSKVVHDLDLNVEAGKESESDHLPSDHKVSSGTSLVEANKEKPLVKRLESTRRDESDASKTSQSKDFTTVNSGNGTLDQTLGPEQVTEQSVSQQDQESFGSKKSDIHMTSIAEGVEGDISMQPDAAPTPLNPLKRSLEIATPDIKVINGPDNLKKTKKEETAVKSTSSGISGSESNGLTKESSDGQATAGKVLEDKDSRITALRSARELDAKITKLGAKLFNLSLRREHMGIDDLGRQYWALTGVDGRPCLVVAGITSASEAETGKGTNFNPGRKWIDDNNASLSTVPQGSKSPSGMLCLFCSSVESFSKSNSLRFLVPVLLNVSVEFCYERIC